MTDEEDPLWKELMELERKLDRRNHILTIVVACVLAAVLIVLFFR